MSDAHWVFGIIALAAIAMATNRIRYDVIALSVVCALAISGLLNIQQALAGFGHPVVILVAALLVIGEMLDRTGVAQRIGDAIMRYGSGGYAKLLALIMVSAALLSSVMSSTAVVAIFIPIVVRIAKQLNLPRGQFLLPMAYGALISGMITLIATPPNLIISEQLKIAGYEGLGFFSFAPLGLIMLAVAVVFLGFFGQKLLSSVQSEQENSQLAHSERAFLTLWKEYNKEEQVVAFRLSDSIDLVGKTLAELQVDKTHGIRMLAVVTLHRGKEKVLPVDPHRRLTYSDVLLVTGGLDGESDFCDRYRVKLLEDVQNRLAKWLWQLGASVLLVHPNANFIGQSPAGMKFRDQFGAQVMAIQRRGEIISDVHDVQLEVGDMLLVIGTWTALEQLSQRGHQFILLEQPSESASRPERPDKASIAIGIVLTMVLVSLLDILSITTAAIIAAVLAVFMGCLSTQQAYRSINLSSLVLIAGMLPLATALEQTGGSQMIVDLLLNSVGQQGPYLLAAALFGFTVCMTLVLSNTASAVLMAPIAIGAAQALGVSPYPLAIAVLLAASTAFATPVASPIVTLVVEPGGYRFSHFLKIGLPLTFFAAVLAIFIAPLLFPF